MNQVGKKIVNLWNMITQPRSEDLQQAQREQFIRTILLLFSLTLVVLTVVLYPAWLAQDFRALLVIVGLGIVIVLSWWLIYIGHPFMAGSAISGAIFLIGAFLSYVDGLNSNATILYAVSMLMFALFFGSTARWVMLGLSIVVHFGLGVFHEKLALLDLISASIGASFSLLAVAMIEGLYSHLLQNALSQSRQVEEKLRAEIVERREMEKRLEVMSTHDELTGLFNRAFFEAELKRMESSRMFPVSLIVGDVVGLKRINDRFGTAGGDALLAQAAKLFSATLRAEDILARIGGDEFAVLLPQTNPATMRIIISRLRKNLDDYNRVRPERAIELSIGTATADAGADLTRLLQLADDHMYEDKFRRKAKLG